MSLKAPEFSENGGEMIIDAVKITRCISVYNPPLNENNMPLSQDQLLLEKEDNPVQSFESRILTKAKELSFEPWDEILKHLLDKVRYKGFTTRWREYKSMSELFTLPSDSEHIEDIQQAIRTLLAFPHFVTSGGSIGQASRVDIEIREGDIICVLRGKTFMSVLRELGTKFLLLGPCHFELSRKMLISDLVCRQL
jgi:hypothetical protein